MIDYMNVMNDMTADREHLAASSRRPGSDLLLFLLLLLNDDDDYDDYDYDHDYDPLETSQAVLGLLVERSRNGGPFREKSNSGREPVKVRTIEAGWCSPIIC
ncbi:unnamed protein product [Heligmosomoides polygyrus]|uniref:Uncharacterized protein n=1 Tax=Heligmosomoides polygyrus TaxID=6339 RepID=A0A183FMQ4_HELPZ|nr:unnamed protein product [Heligmosomoides polygyrus]